MSDDLISRQEVLNKLNKLDQQELYLPCHFKEYIIEEVPSVQPKTGHWICDYKGDHVADYHCSECGRQLGFAFSTQNKKILGGRWKYCDVCGAKMEEKTE